MIRKFLLATTFAMLATGAFAQSGGTEAEAKAMLAKAVTAVKADEAKAVETFNKGEGGFLDRDLYVFCANLTDGKIVANANPNAKQLIGTDIRTLTDSTGKKYGEDLFAGVQKEVLSEVSYLFQRPTDKTPSPKVSFVTKASSDLGCGVGYYKQ